MATRQRESGLHYFWQTDTPGESQGHASRTDVSRKASDFECTGLNRNSGDNGHPRMGSDATSDHRLRHGYRGSEIEVRRSFDQRINAHITELCRSAPAADAVNKRSTWHEPL